MKKTSATITKLFKTLSIDEQNELVRQLGQIVIDFKVAQLKVLSAEVDRLVKDQIAAPGKKSRAKPTPTHRSKKNPKLLWTGRGSLPKWLKAEMKEFKLKADAFRIGKR